MIWVQNQQLHFSERAQTSQQRFRQGVPLKKTEKAVPNLSVYKQQERRDKDNINISEDCFYSIYWNSVVVFGHCVLFNDSACCNRWKKDIFCTFMQSQSILVVSAWISHIKHTFSEDKVCTAHCTLFIQSTTMYKYPHETLRIFSLISKSVHLFLFS